MEMSSWELAECVKVNFENFKKTCPSGVADNPFARIVADQLDTLIRQLELEEED